MSLRCSLNQTKEYRTMLSNSNVFTLLILIEYVTLFDYTLANSVLVNTHTANQTVITPNDTNITNYTLEAVAVTLTSQNVSSIIRDNQQNNLQTIYKSTHRHFLSTTKESKASTSSQSTTTATITSIISTEFPSKNPLQPKYHKLFEKNDHSIVATDINITSSPSSSVSMQSSMNQTINPDEIPLLQDNNTENVHNTSDKTNRQQMPIHKMVSSTLASEKNVSHYVGSKITIFNDKNNGKNVEIQKMVNDCDESYGCDEINTTATNRIPPNEILTNNKTISSIQIEEDNKEINNNNKMHNINSIDYDNDNNMNNMNIGGNDHTNDYHHEIVQADAPITNYEQLNQMPESTIIRSDAVYFVVAVIGGAKIWSRTLLRTLSDMGPPFSGDPLGSPLVPIFIDLPTNGRYVY